MQKSINITTTDFLLPVIHILRCDIGKIAKQLKKLASQETEPNIPMPCVLSIETDKADAMFLARLVESLRQLNFLVVGLNTQDTELIEQAEFSGLAVFNDSMPQLDTLEMLVESEVGGPEQKKVKTESKALENAKEIPTLIHKNTVKKGEQVYAEGTDLIVLGDVEEEAEVIADGHIYIGGSLYGKAYAGNSGLMNIDEITVRAYVFEPQLISIAGFYQLLEDIPENYKGLPVEARFHAQKLQYKLE